MTPEERQLLNEVKETLGKLMKSDRYVFERDIEMAEGRKIVLPSGTGTVIGTETTQKLGFFGATPVVQQTGDGVVSDVGGSYSQSEVQAIVDALNEIINALNDYGLVDIP